MRVPGLLCVGLLCVALLCGVSAFAQNSLGTDLSGEWRVAYDDRAEYASPQFDDGGWRTLTLPLGQEIPVETHWLRRRVALPAEADRTRLALTLGTIQDVYEVYVNGHTIGSSSDWNSSEGAEIPRPRTFAIPADAAGQGEALLIALRVKHVFNLVPMWVLPDEGPYVLSDRAGAWADAGQRQLDKRFVEFSPRLSFGAFSLAVGIVGFVAWWSDQRRRELLWFSLTAFQVFLTKAYKLFMLQAHAHPINGSGRALLQENLDLIYLPLLATLILASLGPKPRWMTAAVWLTWSPMALSAWISLHGEEWLSNVAVALIIVAIVVWDWWRLRRHSNREGHLLRLAFLVTGLNQANYWLSQFPGAREYIPFGYSAGPYYLSFSDVFWLLISVSTLTLLIRRMAVGRRDHQRLAAELAAARAVQQALIAQPASGTDDIPIDAAYEPAREVGGDFYQVTPTGDGARLLLIGDVSGKGLNAAMLVSVVIGAARGDVEASPAAMLQRLNAALAGRAAGGFVTCCCARLAPDGCMIIANAGHLAPYHNGAEIQVDAGLPLGIVQEVGYCETTIHLERADQVTFLSDGVVEAANPRGELFGFERTQSISMRSAHDIAEAAKAWGQNDDITVVTVRRSA